MEFKDIIDHETLRKLVEDFKEHHYFVDTNVIYRGHVPHVGFILLDGDMSLKNRRTNKQLPRGSFIGLRELILGNPIRYDVHIKSGTKVLIIDRSSINEILEDKTLDYYFFFEKAAAS